MITKNRNFYLLIIIAVFALITTTILLSHNHIESENSLMLQLPTNIQENKNILRWNIVEGAKEYEVQIKEKTFRTKTNELSLDMIEPGEYTLYITAISANGEKYNSRIEHKLNYLYSGLKVIPKNITISKTYDGTKDNDIIIEKGIHYEISGLKYGTNVDIEIEDIGYNSSEVSDANKLIVNYSAKLIGADTNKYKFEKGKVEIKANILPKLIEVKPKKFTKQFLDKDILKEEIEVDGRQFECSYTRTEGEEIGKYNVTDVNISDTNYSAAFNLADGEGKFEIIKRIIEIAPLSKSISKIYDGTKEYDVSQIKKGEHYEITKLIPGFDANINIISAHFNSQNASDCNSITIRYSAVLQDSNNVYEITEGQFECRAVIEPKSVNIFPQRIAKQFGDDEVLFQQVQEGNESIDIELLRMEGEAVGKYDIIDVKTNNANYSPSIVLGAGKEKFEIIRRVINVVPVAGIRLEKTYDGGVAYNSQLEIGSHYIIQNLIEGYSADIKITNIMFDKVTVEASMATVYYESELKSGGEHYALIRGSFSLAAQILPKKIELAVNALSKQFGDSDNLSGIYTVEELNESVHYILTRNGGELVGNYDILSAESTNTNFIFEITDGKNKFVINKRLVSVTPTANKITKVFDNSTIFVGEPEVGIHFNINNMVGGYPLLIQFTNKTFNDKNTSANSMTAKMNIDSEYYELYDSHITFVAEISKKSIELEPEIINVQFGDSDNLQGQVLDEESQISVDFVYTRQGGNNVGSYDLLSADSQNANYSISIKSGSGTDKYIILARKLNVKIIDGISFTKKYDNSIQCNSPILQGFHYELENLIGGSDVNIRILTKQYNSKNVLSTTKVIVTYSAILSGADGENYETTQGVFEFPASITARILNIEPYKFVKRFSESESLTQNYYDELTGETVSAYFTRQEGEAVRVYNILSADSRNDNFNLSVINGEGKFEIVRNNITITAYDRTVRFNKTNQGIAQPISQPVKDLIVEYRLIDQTQFTEQLPINAGQYEVKISFVGDDEYNSLIVFKSFVIERIESIITDITPKNYVYDGNIKQVVAQLNHDETQLIYSANDFVRAGKYNNILVSAPQTTNYKASSIVVSFDIAKYCVLGSEVTYPTPTSITFGQYLLDSLLLTNSKYGYFEWDNANIIPPVNNSGYLVRFVPYDMDNYDFGDVEIQKIMAVSVQKAKIIIAPPTAEKINYGDKLSSSTLLYSCLYGSFNWENGNEVLTGGSNYCKAIFTPYDTANYDWNEIPSFYSVLVEVYFPITFNVLGGNILPNLLVETLFSAPTATKKGYVFEGWYLDREYTRAVAYPYAVTEPVTFYALWRTKGLSFTFDSAKGGYVASFDGQYVQRLSIPSSYKGIPVVAISDNAFNGNYTLKYVTIAKSIKTIGTKAFYNCRNILEIHLGESIENLQLGEDWNKTMGTVASDIHFDCKACEFCDGTTDCHIDCPYCPYCGNANGEHNSCLECGKVCDGTSNVKFCLTCGKCNTCVKLCPGCGECGACNESSDKLVCDKCHWCNVCNAENGFEYCVECGNCNSCYDYCSVCKRCETHCKCVKNKNGKL